MTWRRRCDSADATRAAGADLAALLVPGDVLLLVGPLGAGKTTLTQGIARGLGVRERVTSPTFTMVRQHRCSDDAPIRTLHHADVYRVESLGEVADLGLGELADDSAVCVVEWGDIADELFGSDVVRVTLEMDDADVRTITVGGVRAESRAPQLAQWADS